MADANDTASPPTPLPPHGVITGFGVPGRAVADWMRQAGMTYAVVERNEMMVTRCGRSGVPIIAGDARDADALRRAGIERAVIFAVCVPDEAAVLDAVAVARSINPTVRILARCAFISSGMEAVRRGASIAVVAEEVVAREFVRLLGTVRQ